MRPSSPAPAAAVVTGLGLLAALLAGCTGSDEPEEPAAAPSTSPAAGGAPEPDPVDLSLLVFNVEYGGTRATDAVMEDLDADVVGVLESYNRLPKIAEAAGYPYYDVGLQILSKYPILEPSGADGLYAYLEVRPGEAVAMINTHLDYVKDGPRQLVEGVPVEEVLASEDEVRTSSIEKLIPSAEELMADGWPVLLTGDLNEPSHLDWTAETADQHRGFGPVAWPVSRALVDAGMTDVYREAHPDPVTDPGNTWGDVGDTGRMARRIDFAYAGGPVEVGSSQVVGEEGVDGVDLGYPRWTSDHRAVYSELTVTPAPIPTTVALSRRLVTVGEEVTAYWWFPDGTSAGSIGLSGPGSASYDVSGEVGTLDLGTAELPPGRYDVTLAGADGEVVATNQLDVRSATADVEVTTDRATYGVGDDITVSWTQGPANRWDWIGVYRADAANPFQDDYLVWAYTGGHDAGALPPTTDGELVIGQDHLGSPWPLPPGDYVVHYLLTDRYRSAGSAEFSVRR
ncbi:endonuclease/exonuclease/phosphatase family protein [Nocardioides taihuensis]|uniref:Endonuclease/exonuclease/phosphatase family protein n=1 Tax=Nocardioides taihuensis TaxID=1835606 RepID=A0ABW0BD98_9ACTN